MANEKHIKIIKKGVSAWNQWRKENTAIQPDLSEADLRAKVLNGANLSNTLLNGAKLVRTFLHNADLRGANLNNAKLRWATLSGANLTKSKLSFADLREAIFNSAKLDKADLSEANLSQATLQSASLNEANLSGANFSHADLSGSKLNNANLTGAHLANTNLTNAKLTHANLNKAKLSKAQLKGADLSYAELDGTNLSGASLYEADLRNATFTGANLAGADFTRAIADEDQFAPNQLSNKQREQLQFSIEITVKEPASEQTDEKQAKYGEGKYGEGVYDGKGGREGRGERPDGEDKDWLRNTFLQFLIEEKGYPRNSIQLDRRVLDSARRFMIDLVLIIPKTEKIAAIIEFKNRSTSKTLSSTIDQINRYKQNLRLPNIPAYIVCPTINKSRQLFEIYKVMDEEYPLLILPKEFPSFEELKQKTVGKKLTISNFKVMLDVDGIEICDKVIDLAKSINIGLYTDISDESYINLRVTGLEKKSDNVAMQIHRYGEYETTIALAVAGTQKGTEQKEPELNDFIVKGNITKLSGYKKGIRAERAWLNGNLPVRGSREKANVYVIEREILKNPEAWGGVEDLLRLAKAKEEEEKEPEPKKVLKYGKGSIATIQMDRLSDVDLLGRERLVRAFAGMFVHTEEVEGFTVALLGDWGEGKSTVMKLLRKSLNEKHPGRFDFATFNAWEYEHTDNIAAGLAQEVVKGLIEPLQQHFWERQILRFRFALKEYKGELWRLAIYSVVAIFITLVLCLLLPNNTLKGLGLAGGIAAVLFLLFKNLPTIIEHPIAIKVETYLKLPNYGKHLGEIPIIQSHLKTLCLLRLVDKKKLLVFVDDLDRCQTDCIARALDAIRLVMSIPNVIVMIGIDYRIAFKAMENYYEKLGDEERKKSDIARDYLGKIIQLPVRLVPSGPEEVRKYIEKRLFPDAQIMEDIEKDAEIDTERDVIEQQKLIKERIEAEGEEVKVRIPDDKKVEEPKSVEEILKDTSIERDMFSDLAQRFNFTNPRQLLRLRNSYRFLKVMDSDEKYDREILMKILFWHEFLNNWPSIIRDQCEKSVTKQESLEKIEKPEAKQIVQGVQEDILKIIEMPMYEEIERFVRIVVLPHSEEGVLEAREEIVK